MLYTFYSDDFTGSTDVLEQLASNGVSTVLFLQPPTQDRLSRFENIQAMGISGDSRSRSPEWMSENLPAIFAAMKRFNAPINQYKVCSTFDSSTALGSIGRAIELGKQVFSPEFVPVVIAAAHLRRYLVFANLFAGAPDGTIQRIDRHPMAHHPVTPMLEADLRRHLASQTKLSTGLIDLVAIQSGSASTELDRLLKEKTQIILFDGIDYQTQSATGEILWQRAQKRPLFSAASSGLTAALVTTWRSTGLIPNVSQPPQIPKKPQPLLVVSGSCSPITAIQIRWALENGFRGISVDTVGLLHPNTAANELTRVQSAATESLGAGCNTIVYTALGASADRVQGENLGVALGQLVSCLLSATVVRRILWCGGDTSSHAMQQLNFYALTWKRFIQTGAPLCRAYSDDPSLDGLELVLKGGQVGTPDFFDVVRQV